MARTEKYRALRKFLEIKADELKRTGRSSFDMSFADVEAQLGFKLPASAYKHREWWSNGMSGDTQKVWLRASFRTCDVDMARRSLTFEYKGPLSPEDKARREARNTENNKVFRQKLAERRAASGLSDASKSFSRNQIHPAFGSMKGLIRVVAGTDLTAPADPDWGKVYDK
jgi:hypothetical protein